MTQKAYRLFLGIWAAVLVLLYVLSSTNLILHEKKAEIYPVSVIVEDSSDEDYEKLRKGMDRAAQEFHVDLSFITLYKRNDQSQQINLVAREISDGAKAVILSPACPGEAVARLDEMVLNSPLVILGNSFPHAQAVSGISIDYMEAGKLLGQAVRGDGLGGRVCLLTEGLEYGYGMELKDGIGQALSGCPLEVCLIRSDDDLRKVIREGAYPGREAVLIALDEKSLEKAAAMLEEESLSGQTAGLYGIGGTTRVLNYLDKGVIRGMIVHNRFDEGYLSVEKAVEAIQGGGSAKEQIDMEAYYITREDLRNPDYEKMLYPID